jgi:hypothetical protein
MSFCRHVKEQHRVHFDINGAKYVYVGKIPKCVVSLTVLICIMRLNIAKKDEICGECGVH